MRRGLLSWDPNELPVDVLADRLVRLQAAMARDGLDAFLIYTNLVRSSGVCWLTGFTPYWIESLLLVRRTGTPALATALSKRVSEWIRSTAYVEEIINTPKPGVSIGQQLAAAGCKRVGVLELDALPAGSYDDVLAAAPAVELVDGSALFRAVRCKVDAAERKLIEHADAMALAALNQVNPADATDAGTLAGLVERHARLDAAEETYVAVAADLDADARMVRISAPVALAERFAVRTSVAYKGAWVRRTRTFSKTESGARVSAAASAWLDQIARAIMPDRSVAAQLEAHRNVLPGAALVSWMAESCIGSYPLEVVASSRAPGRDAFPVGSYLVLTVELSLDGVRWMGAAPAFVGGSAQESFRF